MENPDFENYQSNILYIQILNRIRIIAIFAQLLLIVVALEYLAIQLPLNFLMGIIFIEIIFQLYSHYRVKAGIKGGIKRIRQVVNFEVFIHILIDSLILATLIYYSGGANNPFIYLLFVFIALGTIMLSARYLVAVTVLQLTLYSLLHNYQQPLYLGDSSPLVSFHLHMAGMWINFAFTAILITAFGLIARKAMSKREKQIHRLREKQLKDEQILSLGIMASGAAHELATPLSTMAIIVEDINHETDVSESLHQDMDLLSQQIDSCRNIIQNLREKSRHTRNQLVIQQEESEDSKQYLKQQLQLIIDNWLVYRPQIDLHQDWGSKFEAANIDLTISVEQAITNLLNNAADASLANSCDRVGVYCNIHQYQLIIEITDFGKGLTPEMRASLGANIQESRKSGGLGWGLFLSNASIERVAGEVHLLETESGGTLTRINLPLTSGGINE